MFGNIEKAPCASLPFNGTYATCVELSDWRNNPDFYNYEFGGDSVVYRGMKLRAGDLILNHTTSKPAALYTAFANERCLAGPEALRLSRH